ncbi:MAG TPA: hypothetical protein VK181_11210, partial [Rhizobium sp.]|nr:hypothetical protein [Rhizobium sp.]
MPVELIRYGFSGGVFSRALQGRSDLEKSDLGLAAAENFFIDYRGGATSRAGFQFCEQIGATSLEAVRFFSFQFNRFLANNYLLVFTPLKLRFIQDGAYVLEAAKTITSIVGNTVNSTAHGYANGELVQISSRTYIVAAAAANSFQTTDFNGVAENPVGTEVQRVYTVDTPYTAEMLPGLQFRQRRDMVRITSLDYPPMDLTRAAHTSWTLAAFNTGGGSVASPSAGFTATPSGAGTAVLYWAVTSVDANGRESYLTSIQVATSLVNYASTSGSCRFSWTPVAGAKYYNVYRSLIFPTAAQSSGGQELGFIGRTYGPSLTDTNITPNFAITPRVYYNPFDEGQISFVNITAAGSGYSGLSTITASEVGGSGFLALTIRNDPGAVQGALIVNAGKGYVAPTLTVNANGGGGTLATATAVVDSLVGGNPAVSIFYGQRAWLMGTTRTPMTLYSGRSDDIFSFSRGLLATASDPYELDIESSDLTPIRFAEALTDNLFIFTDSGVYQIAPSDAGFSSTQRTQNGVGRVRPIPINTELVFAMPDGSGVRAIRPGSVPNAYVDADLTIFSGDYFTPKQEIISWAFSRTPYRVLWCVKVDGRLLSFTYVPEHNIYAWSSNSTNGYALEIANVLESGIDTPYIAVRRENGVFIERMVYRAFETVEDIWSVDSGLSTSLTYPTADIAVVDLDDTAWTVTADAAIFSAGDVGKHFRAGGGMGVVIASPSSTTLTVEKVVDIVDRRPQQDRYPDFAEGDWSLTSPITTVSGLRHLANQTIEVLADGSYLGEFVVSATGTITLDAPASKIIAGLGFDGYIETLPLTASDQVIDNRRKRPVGVALRVEESRGLWYGVPDHMYEMFDRTTERYGEPTRFQSGIRNLTIRS